MRVPRRDRDGPRQVADRDRLHAAGRGSAPFGPDAGAVAELAKAVGSPRLDGAVREQREVVITPGCDCGRVGEPAHGDLGGAVAGRTVSERAVAVVPPGPGGVAG